MLALEAGSVEDDAVGGELVHRVHRLGAHLALLLRPAKHLPPPPIFLLPRGFRGRREAREICLTRAPPDPALACARGRERGGMNSSAPAASGGCGFIRRRRGRGAQLSSGIMTGSSPPARLTFAAAERKSQQQTSERRREWDDGGTAQHSAVLLLIKLVRNYDLHH